MFCFWQFFQMQPVQVHRLESNEKLKNNCQSCRISGAVTLFGIAAYVASHYKEMPTKKSKIGVAIFSAGM